MWPNLWIFSRRWLGADEAHLGDQDLRLEARRVVVQARRAGVAGVGQRAACAPRASPPRRRAAGRGSCSPGRPTYSSLSLLRRSQTRKPSDGIVCVVANDGDDVLARQLDLVAGLDAAQRRTTCRPRSSRCMISSSLLHVLDGSAGHVDRRRLHLHHAPAGDVDRQGGDVVEVRVRDEPGRRAHEVPRLRRRGRSRSSVRGCASSSARPRASTPRSSARRGRATGTGRCPPGGRGSCRVLRSRT